MEILPLRVCVRGVSDSRVIVSQINFKIAEIYFNGNLNASDFNEFDFSYNINIQVCRQIGGEGLNSKLRN